TAGVGASEALRRVNVGERELDAAARGHLSDLYDASLAECDAAVGAFLQRLRDSGHFDDAVILVVSDHGEALGERDQTMHGELMDATLHIPMLLHLPGGSGAGSVRDDLVETVDIAPTLLTVAGLPPEEISQGVDLRVDSGRGAAFHRSGPDYAVSTGEGWRLFHRQSASGLEWTHLRRYGPGIGPADGVDVLADSLAVIDPHVESIQRWHAANRAVARRFSGAEVRMSGADEDLLRSLGYID
ncbi:MAG TPA: sulfatase-like hydrolase/transferase, partial [Nitriliruptorales bacterium]